LAVILSVCVAGLGQAYSGFLARGLVLHLAWQGVGLILLFALVRLQPLRLNLFLALFIYLLVWLFINLDAFRCAKRNSRGYELKWYNRWYVYLLFFVVVFLANRSLARTVRSNYIEAFKLPTGSMMPTVLIGDHIFVDKRAYRDGVTNRGDLVIFSPPNEPGVTLLKRLVGLPGETIEIRAKRVLLNGAAIEEPYAYYSEPPGGAVVARRDVLPALKLPPDEFFLLGDNRDHSWDSRFFGPVARTHILGKAKLIYFSWDPTTRHIRWQRLGQPLAGQQWGAELAGQAIMRLADKGYIQKGQARLVSAPQPVYPPLARNARIQGVVKLQALIDTDGSIAHLSLISGHPLLVKAAMDAVQHWRYEPTVVNGKAVTAITEIDVNFKLTPQGDKTETPAPHL
jgi:signal peptidase I